jgi:hypothetical protein
MSADLQVDLRSTDSDVGVRFFSLMLFFRPVMIDGERSTDF